MNKQEQLAWEARWARPAALAAFLAGVFSLVQVALVQSAVEDRRGVEGLPDLYLSIDDNSGPFIAGAVVQALGALALMGVFLYLYRATAHRESQMPKWFIYFVFAGPILYALSSILGSFDQVDKASEFVDRGVFRGERGGDVAEDVQGDINGVTAAFAYAGTIAVAFLFVMLPLRARRVGLLSAFMGILGVICGALLVLPLLPPIVQLFWLLAIAALFLGKWPGGRGPAWESGESEPWPSPAQRRALEQGSAAGGNGAAPNELPADALDEPEPAPDRRSSRKRRRR